MKQVEYYKNGNRTLRIKYEGIKKLLEKQDKEIERLQNIIKEVRERIMLKQLRLVNEETYNILHNDLNELLEILDKGE